MSDEEHFEVVLEELRQVMLDFADLAERVVLVGGQVLALEARARGMPADIVVMAGDARLERGFSFEPDLFIDFEGTQADHLEGVLRRRGYTKARHFRWTRDVSGYRVELDLFSAEDVADADVPLGTTPLAGGDAGIARPHKLRVKTTRGELEIKVPDAAGFFTMKLEAMDLRRAPKDAFDIYAYVALCGCDEVADALAAARADGALVVERLRSVFGEVTSRGVEDVLAYSPTMDVFELDVARRVVVDTFEQLEAAWRRRTSPP